MMLNFHKNHKAYFLYNNIKNFFIRDGEKGAWERQKSEIIYILSLHCHHQNDSCIKMGSGESHFNVSLTVGGKVTRQCPQSTT